MAAVRISWLRSLCSSAKANCGFEIEPCVAYTSRSYHTRECGHVQNLESNSSRILCSNSAIYARCSRGGYFDACYTNKLLGNSVFRGSFVFVGISPFVSNRLFSSSSEGKSSITRGSNVIADSGASGSSVTDGGVGQDGWIDKANDIWQSAVGAVKYSGGKAKEMSDEAAPHVQKFFDTYPYLRDVIVPVGGTLVGTLLAWSLLPSILRRFHRYSVQNPVALLARNSLWGSVPYEKSFWSAMEDPVRYFITFVAFLQIGEMVAPTVIASEYFVPAWRGAFVVSLVWFLQRWKTNVIARALAAKSMEHVDRDKLLTLDKISSVGLLVVGLMALAEACGVAVQSVITVGGVGGVATAFAARDILGNVLSGLSVQMSRPFSIGDTIKAGSVEGQVVDMGLTTTSLLTAEKFPVIVPNSLFSSQVIVNKSRAKWRTMSTKIPLQIDDIDKISQISEDIKSMLRSNSNVFLEKEAPYCFLSCIERSYAVLTFGCNLKTVGNEAEQDILLQAVRIIQRHGAALGRTQENTLH
ncbi:mechanosensitive ion channel protein 1, mitochondrial isoform X1 [Henckelia pumila]|uniref:mechanosensitive ion channel protein 1, mitochondrial isoform X1 n=1 Tax=Henckelia pumila TaxID=405737 RepID=UPI003C6DCE24